MDDRLYRDALGRFATGVTVVTTEYNHHIMAMTVNAFMSVSLSPKLIAISIDQKARMYHPLQQTGQFGISILTEDQELHSRHFAKQLKDEQLISFKMLKGVPILEDSLASLACRVTEKVKAGDHLLFIAEVSDFNVSNGEPIIFYGGKYRKIET
ncbi:flavin reductase family protein [Ornithinibacillus xuwenensis]|uniref:Flavin reductase family protein n=1 Tax=Ornithinibacillus xuwenensis TaxID=3144668 RepID=A0ABU9XGQ8_9BACI